MKTKNREQRIAEAKAKVDEIEERMKPMKDELQQAKFDLYAAETSFDVGERVRVSETCNRGCCVERLYTGTVTGRCENGSNIIMSDSGGEFKYVSHHDMKRL